MGTVSKHIANKVIAGRGIYPGDHLRVVKVVKYQNAFDGSDAYGLIYDGKDPSTYDASGYVINPKTIWEYDSTVPVYSPQQLQNWLAYEAVRSSGKYNMFQADARIASGLTIAQYQHCMLEHLEMGTQYKAERGEL